MLKYFTPLWSKYVINYSQVIKNTAKLIFKSLIDWDVAIDKLVTLRKFNVNKLYPTLKEKVDHNVQYKSTAGSENSTDHSHSIESIQAYQALCLCWIQCTIHIQDLNLSFSPYTVNWFLHIYKT